MEKSEIYNFAGVQSGRFDSSKPNLSNRVKHFLDEEAKSFGGELDPVRGWLFSDYSRAQDFISYMSNIRIGSAIERCGDRWKITIY